MNLADAAYLKQMVQEGVLQPWEVREMVDKDDVDDLVRKLAITPNEARTHLAALELSASGAITGFEPEDDELEYTTVYSGDGSVVRLVRVESEHSNMKHKSNSQIIAAKRRQNEMYQNALSGLRDYASDPPAVKVKRDISRSEYDEMKSLAEAVDASWNSDSTGETCVTCKLDDAPIVGPKGECKWCAESRVFTYYLKADSFPNHNVKFIPAKEPFLKKESRLILLGYCLILFSILVGKLWL